MLYFIFVFFKNLVFMFVCFHFFSFHHFYYFRSENKLSIFASIDKGQSISISVIVFVTEVPLMASGYHNMWLSWWMCTVCRCTYYECNCIALLHYMPMMQQSITYCDCHSQQNNVTSVQKFKWRWLSLLTLCLKMGVTRIKDHISAKIAVSTPLLSWLIGSNRTDWLMVPFWTWLP